MRVYFLLAVVFAGVTNHVLAQSGAINGVVYEQDQNGTRTLMKAGASVFVPGVGSGTTDGNGRYTINLGQCSSCRPGSPLRLYVNSPAGFAEEDIVIPAGSANHPVDVTVIPNSKLALDGVVRSKRTGSFLKGIRVTMVIQGSGVKVPPVFTDDNGAFLIVLNRAGIGSMQAVDLLLSDAGQNRYKDDTKTVFINKYGAVTIELEDCNCTGTVYHISRLFTSITHVDPGDVVQIRAEGVIHVGQFVGNSGPAGLERGVLGMDLDIYNIYKGWNHGALVFRFGDNDIWHYYDGRGVNEFNVQTSGYIEFNINDNHQQDNSGAYKVTVMVKK